MTKGKAQTQMTLEEEAKQFLAAHPEMERLEVLIADMNGMFRGKQLPVSALKKVLSGGIYFPYTTPFLTTDGANAESVADTYGSDPDRRCRPVPGTLKPVPWATRPTTQIMLSLEEDDGADHFADPRHVLARALARLAEMDLTPVVALEYEFFLFKAGTTPPAPLTPPNGLPHAKGANCYNLDVYSDYEPLMAEIEAAAAAQGLDVTSFVCEYGNGQFEVNLNHQADALKACDDALLLKRVIKGVGTKHGLLASFMAKPLADEVGNGLHAHVSLMDASGANIFGQEGGEEKLRHALGGLISTMPAATAFFAPNANSYRRFDPEWFAPVVPNWGENNRRLSLRLPLSDTANRRLEHRVSGADASPHLVLAAILAGMHHGLEQKLDPGAPVGEFDGVDYRDTLPPRWKMALDTLRNDQLLSQYFGKEFIGLYLDVREWEEEEYHRGVGPADYEQYLRLL